MADPHHKDERLKTDERMRFVHSKQPQWKKPCLSRSEIRAEHGQADYVHHWSDHQSPTVAAPEGVRYSTISARRTGSSHRECRGQLQLLRILRQNLGKCHKPGKSR